MAANDSFKEITEEDIPLLVECLHQDIPNSIHAYTFLKVMQAWKLAATNFTFKILALNGNFRTKMVLLYWLTPDKLDCGCSFHKWTHREDDSEAMTEALRRSALEIRHARSAEISGMTPETSNAVMPAIEEIWAGQNISVLQEYVFWIPREEALSQSIECPPGTEMRYLTKDHSKEIVELWPWRSGDPELFKSDKEMFSVILQNNFGIGLFDSQTGELMAWEVQTYYGAMGALQTKERHKRKGYARILKAAVSKEIARRGYDVFSLVVTDNTASISLHKQLKYRVAYICTTIDITL